MDYRLWATCHISNDQTFFETIDYFVKESVSVACVLKVVNSKSEVSSITIQDVYFIPLITVTDKGLNVNFSMDSCRISKDNFEILIAKLEPSTNLYTIKQQERCMSIKTCEKKCHHYWHRVLGHRDPEAIKKVIYKELATGIEIEPCGQKRQCELCLQGKFSQLKLPKKSLSKTKAPLDLIHSDVCGPMQTESPSGKRYYVTFIDDYTRYCHVYVIARKSEVYEKFKESVALAFNKFKKYPDSIRYLSTK